MKIDFFDSIFRLKFFILVILLALFHLKIEAKPAELNKSDVPQKMNEIMSMHTTYKQLSPLLVERAINNFINSIDPSKTYFLKDEVNHWVNMPTKDLEHIISDFKKGKFPVFEEILNKAQVAIKRRELLEKEINSESLPQDVSPKEFKNLDWCDTKKELHDRLKRLRALQLNAVSKMGHDAKEKVLQRLQKRRQKYEDELTTSQTKLKEQTLCTLVLKSFASALDADTYYFTPTEANQFKVAVQQKLLGIGVKMQDDFDGFTVIEIVPGGPADLGKKLKLKDKIIAINGEPIIGYEFAEVVDLIRGKGEAIVTLRVQRTTGENNNKAKEVINIPIKRGEVVFNEMRFDYFAEPFGTQAIAYMHLHSFYQDNDSSSTSDIEDALKKMEKENHIAGVILDLRFNGGGILSQAVSVSGLFLKKGVIVSIKDEHSKVYHLRNLDTEEIWKGPLIVLINRASASAAEIVAQALQDYGRAIIIGDDTSFGKGCAQTTSFSLNSAELKPKGEYKVTRGRYYTVSGKSPQLVGVKSDIVIPSFLTSMEIGEKYTRYPLDNDSIPPNFQDPLDDLSPYQQKTLKKLYKTEMQKKETYLLNFIPTLKLNSETRLKNNKNYQLYKNVLTDMLNSTQSQDEANSFTQYTDFQLQEAFNIMKDLILIYEKNRSLKEVKAA